jgi:hypothetical protein
MGFADTMCIQIRSACASRAVCFFVFRVEQAYLSVDMLISPLKHGRAAKERKPNRRRVRRTRHVGNRIY